MSHIKEMSNVLIDSVLSSLGNFRLFGFEEEKPVPVIEPEPEPYVPPEPITLEKLKELNSEFGIIYTCFPENRGESKFSHLPESYSTLRPKEKLLLLFAENFRRQFKERYQLRRPLLLAVENECQVQKFVSTTIKPTTFIEFPELIDNWQACSNFVADHVLYESLEHATKIPTRLYSPEMVLKSRRGNSFEVATLLCSILIGFGFPAMVVSGYATREVTMNDQRRVNCPYIPEDKIEIEIDEEPDPKYRLKDSPFLKSRFLMQLEQKKKEAENEILAEIEREKQLEIEMLERPPPDPENGFRTHSWIVMIKSAPWCFKDEFKRNEEQDDDENAESQAFFLEPSTGFRHELTDSCYQGIESIWNHQNYYVNRQYPVTPIEAMSWDLSDGEKWEHFLPGEPYELRKERKPEDDEDAPAEDEILAVEKHLDMPFSWVDLLHISAVDFEERYLNGEKKIFFKYSTYEKFAPYKNADGLMKRLTIFETLNHENPLKTFEWYENRNDLMISIKRDLKTGEIIEEFQKGRSESLKSFIRFTGELPREVVMKFYAPNRFDNMEKIVYHSTFIEEFYEKKRDLLYYRKFFVKESPLDAVSKAIEKIIEKFNRNEQKPANHDIAVRHFNRNENKIFVQFHYDDDAVTATTKIFTKPPRSEEEPTFNAGSIEGYVSNPWAPQLTSLELYYLLQSLLKDEEKSVDQFHIRDAEIKEILELRQQQIEKPLLKFSIFDPLRNESARKMRLQRFEQMKTRELLAKNQQADFLAPYLVRFEDKKPTKEDFDEAIKDCLRDFKQNYIDMENELQRRYDESTSELNSLKRFLHRYMDQFSVQEYEKLIYEGENIERYRKIIQQRIVAVSEEANRKYKNLLESIPSRLEQVVKQDDVKNDVATENIE